MKQIIQMILAAVIIISAQNIYSSELSPLKQGMKLYHEGKYELSLVFLERAFKEVPMDSRLYFYLGNLYNHKKMYTRSIEAFKRALELNPGDNRLPILYNLARTFQAAKQYKEALNTFNSLEKESDRYPEIHLYRGMIYYNLQNKREVVSSWETYLAKSPSNPQYKSVRNAIDLIKRDDFKWPLEVAKGGRGEDKKVVEDSNDNSKPASEKEIKEAEEKLVQELKKKEEEKAKKEVEDSVSQVKVESENLDLKGQEKKEGKEYEEIER